MEECCDEEYEDVCDHFEDNDQGVCLNCGHLRHCHEEDLK
jgi:hypothetical protein